jgi:hypothetical protein
MGLLNDLKNLKFHPGAICLFYSIIILKLISSKYIFKLKLKVMQM